MGEENQETEKDLIAPFMADGTTPRCTAHTREFRQCPRAAMDGSTVCMKHGGGVPVARAAAKKRLLAMVPAAMDAIAQAIEKADWPQVVRAAFGILDRAGMGPQSTVTVETDATPEALAKLSDDELTARTLQALAVLEQRKQITKTTTNEGTSDETPDPSDIVH